jgi:hypothetical protein
MIHVIGAGGTGGWLTRLLRKTVKHTDWKIYDKDIWEEKNLDRQFCTPADIGKFKVETLCAELGLASESAVTDWFTPLCPVANGDVLFCCADNHTARVCALDAVDTHNARMAIVCGNELTTAQAYAYTAIMQGTRLDPRVRYPELLTDHSGDPTRPCTGAYQEQNKQLALSNLLAAGFGVWLYWYWTQEHKKCTIPEAKAMAPVEMLSSATGMRTITWKELDDVK